VERTSWVFILPELIVAVRRKTYVHAKNSWSATTSLDAIDSALFVLKRAWTATHRRDAPVKNDENPVNNRLHQSCVPVKLGREHTKKRGARAHREPSAYRCTSSYDARRRPPRGGCQCLQYSRPPARARMNLAKTLPTTILRSAINSAHNDSKAPHTANLQVVQARQGQN
jgi:hypothetical protein